MDRSRRAEACENLNHQRANARVAFCPDCGGAVNAAMRVSRCSESDHAAARGRNAFCSACGTQLVTRR